MTQNYLQDSDGFIFDLDGTLYLGNVALPYAADAVALVRSKGKKVAFLTNSALHHRRFYARKLTRMGIPATVADIMTSACGTALWLKNNSHARSLTAFVVGEEGLVQELAQVGVQTKSGWPVEFVVVGLDRGFSYQKLLAAQQAILKGARFVATNADPVFPTDKGVVPGGGSLVKAIASASGVTPKVIGKPHAYLIRQVLREWGMRPQQCLLVGDSLSSDVGAARAAGVWSALVLTGLSHRSDAEVAQPSRRPHLLFDDLGQFCRLLQGK